MHIHVDYAWFSAHCFQSQAVIPGVYTPPPHPTPHPSLLLFSAFRKCLSMTLEKQGSSISLRISVRHNWPARHGPLVFKCLPWSSVVACVRGVDPPVTCEVQLGEGKGVSLPKKQSHVTPSSPPTFCSRCSASKAE